MFLLSQELLQTHALSIICGRTQNLSTQSNKQSPLCVYSFYCNRGLLSSHTPREFHQLYYCSSQNKYTRSNAI